MNEPLDMTGPQRVKVIKAAPAERGVANEPEQDEKSAEQEKSEQALREKHGWLMSLYRRELEIQEANRFEMALDEDYYDGIQLSEEELRDMNKRGQPPTIYNVLATSLNWVFGSEKRGRTDDKILPRGKEDAKAAERKTKYMKYLSDTNRSTFHRSRAFEDCAKVGVGWLECGLQDEDDGEPIFERSESWRNVIYDSAGSPMDQSDWRYLFRPRWVDEDVAKAMFKHVKDGADKIERSISTSSVVSGFDGVDGDTAMDFEESERDTATSRTLTEYKRNRVRLIQAEYRMPEEVDKIVGGPFNGQIFDENDPRHAEQVQTGQAKIKKKMMMRMRLAIMTPSEMLYDGPSIYRHNSFSLTPIWCYRRGRDGMPYGIVRNLRPIQDSINKRASKALQILSSNKTLVETGALAEGFTMDDLAEEASRHDAIIPLATGGISRIKMDVDRGMDQAHMAQFSTDVQMIQSVGGITDENMGRETNARSGVAVKARQEQGSLATSGPFDNLRLAHQLHGEKKLSLVEQFATEAKQFRITNMRGAPEFVQMNDGLPENDITRSKADFVISEADWRATMRQAATAEFGELLTRMPPEVAMSVLDLLVDEMDLSNRDEIVKRIRAMNGGKDPDATEPTPEDQAAEQQKAQQAQMQQRDVELQFAEREAKIADTQASTEDKLANVAKKAVDADVARSVMFNNNMTGANSAMSAAMQVIQAPTIARVADGIMQQGGWQGGLKVPANLPNPAAQGLPQQIPQQPPQEMMPPEMAAPIEPQQPPMA